MNEQFYYTIDGKRNGPISLVDLRESAVKADLKRTDLVWCRGMKAWQPAESIEKLFEDLPPDLEPEATPPIESHIPMEGKPILSPFAEPRTAFPPNPISHSSNLPDTDNFPQSEVTGQPGAQRGSSSNEALGLTVQGATQISKSSSKVPAAMASAVIVALVVCVGVFGAKTNSSRSSEKANVAPVQQDPDAALISYAEQQLRDAGFSAAKAKEGAPDLVRLIKQQQQ